MTINMFTTKIQLDKKKIIPLIRILLFQVHFTFSTLFKYTGKDENCMAVSNCHIQASICIRLPDLLEAQLQYAKCFSEASAEVLKEHHRLQHWKLHFDPLAITQIIIIKKMSTEGMYKRDFSKTHTHLHN